MSFYSEELKEAIQRNNAQIFKDLRRFLETSTR